MILLITHAAIGITIVLAPNAEIRGNEITLGKVARIQDADPADAARLSALELGYAPTPGYSRALRQAELAATIARACPDLNVVFSGAKLCRVAPKTETVKADAITTEARKAVGELFIGRDATIESIGQIADVEAPHHENALELRALLRERQPNPGSWTVGVQIWVDGALFQTVWANLNVAIYEELPVLTRSVRRGEALAIEAFEPRRMRVTSASAGAPLSSSMIPGALALHDLAPGAVIFEQDVERARLVKRGDVVELSIKKGSVMARASVLALQDGRLGDRIRILTTDKKRELQALVVGQGAVEVDLGGQR